MVGFIYITTCVENGKKYIGRKNYNKGWEKYLGSSKPLKEDIKKYGANCFTREIIEECATYKELQERELYWQLHYKVKESKDYYNITYATKGFDTSGSRFTMTDELREKSWPKERREACSNRWKDPKINPNNIQHVRDERSKRMKETTIFKDPYFRSVNLERYHKPFLIEYEDEIYEFLTVAEACRYFGLCVHRVMKKGKITQGKNKGMTFRGYVDV